MVFISRIYRMGQAFMQHAATFCIGVLLFGLLQAAPVARSFASVAIEGFSSGPSLLNKVGKASGETASEMPPLGITPTIVLDEFAAIDMLTFQAEIGGSDTLYYFVEFYNFNMGDLASLTVNDQSGSFTVSLLADSGFGTSLNIEMTGETPQTLMIWVKYAPTTAGPHIATITHTGDGAEPVTLNLEGNTPELLPVELLSFKAIVENEDIVLDWSTASETNNSYFEVEMMQSTAAGFKQAGKVVSKASKSTSLLNYTFRYLSRGGAGTYYFRLKQIDVDNAFTYSNIIAISILSGDGLKLQVAPNPVTCNSRLCITAAEAGVVKVVVSDMNGTAVYSQLHEIGRGENFIGLSLDEKLPSGMYILKAASGSGVKQLRLVKNH